MQYDWIKIIKDHYARTGKQWPTPEQALLWVATELGEAADCCLTWTPGWVRNNPDKHPVATEEQFAEELGDIIMMTLVAGIVVGVDPLEALYRKLGE